MRTVPTAKKAAAVPGTSNHGLGLAADLADASGDRAWGRAVAGAATAALEEELAASMDEPIDLVLTGKGRAALAGSSAARLAATIHDANANLIGDRTANVLRVAASTPGRRALAALAAGLAAVTLSAGCSSSSSSSSSAPFERTPAAASEWVKISPWVKR